MIKKRILISIAVQILLASSLSAVSPPSLTTIHRPKKLDKGAFLQITKSSPFSVLWKPPKNKVKEDSVFQHLQSEYGKLQQTFVSESRSLSREAQEGIDDLLPYCGSCRGTVLGRERTQCYAGCMTREMDTFMPYAMFIGDTVQNFFCMPLGFGFDGQYSSSTKGMHPVWFWNFPEFVKQFNEYNETFSMSTLTEAWMSNLLWLEKSPLYLHSYIRSQIALDIANNQNNPSDIWGSESPDKFATKCGAKWDLRGAVYSLLNAASMRSHVLDVILRGLFTVRSAAFYTLGSYHNLAGGIIEALGAMIGAKCDVIAYSEGQEISDDTCDGIGKFPIPQFPTPMIFSKLLSPCLS